jgi:hypothetical protein
MQIRNLLWSAALTGLFASLYSVSGMAQVLLIIDISKPSAVVITSTGNATTSTLTGYDYYSDGLTLTGFFAPHAYEYGSSSGPNSLTTYTNASGTTSSNRFTTWENSSLSTTGGADVDLNLYDINGGGNLSFYAGQPAFVPDSTVVYNLSGLDIVTTGGDIYEGYTSSHDRLIGTYEVIGAPEPSVWAMLVAGVAALSMWARFRRVT